MNNPKTIAEYMNEISSATPTPGGGNVSAFCGVLATSLGTMVTNLTIGKKKYAEVEEEVKILSGNLQKLKDEFEMLAEKDNEAFEKVMEAFKLPKDSEEQKEFRSKLIEEAYIGAAQIPEQVIKNSYSALKIIDRLSLIGNKNSISDAGVAALLLITAANGAYLNVLINCVSLSNQTYAQQVIQSNELLINDINNLGNFIKSNIIKSIRS